MAKKKINKRKNVKIPVPTQEKQEDNIINKEQSDAFPIDNAKEPKSKTVENPELTKLDKLITNRKAVLEEYEKNIDGLKSEKQNIENEITEMQNNLKALDLQIKNKEEQVKIKEQEAQDIIEKAVKEIRNQKESMMKEIDDIKRKLKAEEKDLLKKEEGLEFREDEVVNKENKLKRLKEIYDKANPEMMEECNEKIDRLTHTITSLQNELQEIYKKNDELMGLKRKTDGKSYDDLQTVINQLNQDLKEEIDRVHQEKEHNQDLKNELKVRIQEIRNNEKEITRLQNNLLEINSLKVTNETLEAVNNDLLYNLNAIKKSLESNTGDICPALTKIDIDFDEQKPDKLDNQKNDITLFNIVEHIKKYASNIGMFYSSEDISAFLASLNSSRLVIIQGLSGTGKSRLPEIFMDAIDGRCDTIPIESSWRDRNELLGYYNDFNKKFTAKEFTCSLYKSGKKIFKNTPYFIVLDELNLSRIEYYFADFLSVLEKEHKQIILTETDLRSLPNKLNDDILSVLNSESDLEKRSFINEFKSLYDKNSVLNENQEQFQAIKLKMIEYLKRHDLNKYIFGPKDLIEGKIIKIPNNVWFIGTANRDESTFEITDKVYDRAQVLNFNDRAKGDKQFYTNEAFSVTLKDLHSLYADSEKNEEYKFENDVKRQEIINYLKKFFDISIGHRILQQINKFIPVYCSCRKASGKSPNNFVDEALDYQITNKILRKMENRQYNKEKLNDFIELLKLNNLPKAVSFIEKNRDQQ